MSGSQCLLKTFWRALSERSGVHFGVSGQNCDQALAAARQEAITQAEGDSLDLAKALGLVRGGIIAALERDSRRREWFKVVD